MPFAILSSISIIVFSTLTVINFVGIVGSSNAIFEKDVESKNSIKIKSSGIYNFDYTGGEQTFIAPKSGKYKLEIWGASGNYVNSGTPGYGGYSEGIINLNKNSVLYVVVGSFWDKHGYNGGGEGYDKSPYIAWAGGATHIATKLVDDGLLKRYVNDKNNVLIVSGGGGGAERVNGGNGGGFKGNSADSISGIAGGTGGAQESGGVGALYMNVAAASDINGSFGAGGSGASLSDSGSNGGGGWYGGGGTTYYGAGGGGSGYIGNGHLTDKHMACYNCETSDDESTKTISVTCASETPTADCAKKGNGYARITYLGF